MISVTEKLNHALILLREVSQGPERIKLYKEILAASHNEELLDMYIEDLTRHLESSAA